MELSQLCEIIGKLQQRRRKFQSGNHTILDSKVDPMLSMSCCIIEFNFVDFCIESFNLCLKKHYYFRYWKEKWNVYLRNTCKTVDTINIHWARTTDTFSAGLSKWQCWIQMIFYVIQLVKNHVSFHSRKNVKQIIHYADSYNSGEILSTTKMQ